MVLTFREVPQFVASSDVLAEGSDVKPLVIVNGAKGV